MSLSKKSKHPTGFRFNPEDPAIYSHPNPYNNRRSYMYKPPTLKEIHNINSNNNNNNNNNTYANNTYATAIRIIEKMKSENKKKGGGPMPLRFFDVNAEQSSADAGTDIMGISGNIVRPAIGGKRKNKHTRRVKGGFFPSIMEPFVLGCSKYIAPLAGLSAWKLINRPTKKSSKLRRH